MNSLAAGSPGPKSAKLSARALCLGTRLCDVSLELAAGECIVLTGPNGSGKSSLLRVLLGLEEPDGGQLELDQRAYDGWSRTELASRLGWLPQRPGLAEPRTVEELVAAGRFRFRESESVARAAALRALASLDAAQLVGRRTDRISGGELQRVLLATLVAQEAPLLLVDEPANHLDPEQQVAAYRALGRLWQQGHGLLVVTHELGLVRLLGDPTRIRVLGLAQGRVALDERLDSPDLPAALARLSGVPFRAGRRPGDVSVDWEALE